MKTNIYSATIIFTVLIFVVGCSTSHKGSSYAKADVEAKNTEVKINMEYPVNTAGEEELRKSFYTENSKYFFRQNKENQFKDNAPFVEILDGGKRERFWFSSSRADDLYGTAAPTNLYQQLYYCEREVGLGVNPRKGWGEPTRFLLKYDKSQLKSYIEGFNLASKGAATVSNGSMIFSCEQWTETEDWNSIRSSIRNLWEVDLNTYPYSYPVQIEELSNSGTWESQPTLSANGKHIFFVSDRMVDNNNSNYSSNERGADLNIFYSFKGMDGKWRKPVLVKELYSDKNEVSPQISIKGDKLYFSCDKSDDYDIYEIDLALDDFNGGYSLTEESLKPFDSPLFDVAPDNKIEEFYMNGSYNQKYPFYYYNPLNVESPQAFFWASDNPTGLGSYDIYACAMPFNVKLNVSVVDLCTQGGNEHVVNPVIKLSGAKEMQEFSETTQFDLYSELTYEVRGGSTASPENGTYSCDVDQSYIFTGYASPNDGDPCAKESHLHRISGSEVLSEATQKNGKITIHGIVSDTAIFDTVYITKAWEKKRPCPGKLNIEPTYRSIAYFQTGYWDVNTTENLKRDMALLHEGFDVSGGDIYNPSGKITRNRSDYKTVGFEAPTFPIKNNDHYSYSIANAPWIELHPNNRYWGDRPGYENKLEQRMAGRKKRIEDYVDFAQKVDTNLRNLTDTIKNNYIQLLDLHKEQKPKLLIEIIAVSDPREVSRSWYIGDTVEYRGTTYDEIKKQFNTTHVKIVPPSIDEKTKTVFNIKPCTVDLNSDGDNGSVLGILTTSKTDQNTNLSRLRAWFGYKEVIKHLVDSDKFNSYLNEGKVALPDNDVSFEDADIIIITYGRRTDDDIENPQYPYPSVNNPTGNGCYDYDGVRRIEIQTRLLFTNEVKTKNDYCCDPVGVK